MTNHLVQRPWTGEDRRLFDLYVGRRNIARVDITTHKYEHANGFVSITQRRHAVRWYWLMNKRIGKGESMSPEEAAHALREMEINVDQFMSAAEEIGWGSLA